jgi:hypothetical protein
VGITVNPLEAGPPLVIDANRDATASKPLGFWGENIFDRLEA